MTEEDMKYRQGRSRKQVESSYKLMDFLLVFALVSSIIGLIISII